jgi:hypothetical protein
MAAFFKTLRGFATMYPILGASALASSLADIDHVILFMQGWCTSLPHLSTG